MQKKKIYDEVDTKILSKEKINFPFSLPSFSFDSNRAGHNLSFGFRLSLQGCLNNKQHQKIKTACSSGGGEIS